MLTHEIKKQVNTLWDKFWSGGIANPITAIEQISYLLFLHRLDEMDTQKIKDAKENGVKYKSLFSGIFKLNPDNADEKGISKDQMRWSKFKEMPAEQMLGHIQQYVFPFIKRELNKEDEPFAMHMQNAYFAIPKPTLLDDAVKIIDKIYSEIKKQNEENGQTFFDTQGDLYEYLLNEISRSGKNGQFRTPRHIIQMICELVDPQLGEKICDPACGTGGFLLGAYQHILTSLSSIKTQDENGFYKGTKGDLIKDAKTKKQLNEDTFYGYDFDTTMVRIGLMNLLLHGIGRPNINYTDTLGKQYKENNTYNVVLANPPFKGSIDKSDINDDLTVPGTKTELLFVNRIINMLDINGRAGVIIPDGVLFGSSKAHVALRKMLLYRCRLDAVISMPSGVFKPYAGVSTAALIFTKLSNEESDKMLTERVWFYEMQSDGYTLDDKREKEVGHGDLQDVIVEFKGQRSQKKRTKYFYISSKEIADNGYDLNVNRYKEIVFIEKTYDPPKELLKVIMQAEDKILKQMAELNDVLL